MQYNHGEVLSKEKYEYIRYRVQSLIFFMPCSPISSSHQCKIKDFTSQKNTTTSPVTAFTINSHLYRSACSLGIFRLMRD